MERHLFILQPTCEYVYLHIAIVCSLFRMVFASKFSSCKYVLYNAQSVYLSHPQMTVIN